MSNNAVLAQLLGHSARTLAAYTAGDLLTKAPSAATGFGPAPHAAWQSLLAARIEDLAAALGFDRPLLFAAQVRWAKSLLAARGIDVGNFRLALETLREVAGNELAEELRPSVLAYIDRGLQEFNGASDDVMTSLLPETAEGRLAAAYLLAVLEGDRRKASRLIVDAASGGHDVRSLYLDVLLPAQAEVGRMWVAGEVNVAEEHFASTVTKAVMAQLQQRATYAPANGRTFLAAAVMGNYHDVGLSAVADFFEMDGWRTVPLGANVPPEDLIQAVDFFRCDVLGLSVSLSTQLPVLRETIRAVRQTAGARGVKILIGGRALAETGDLPDQLGADGYTVRADDAVALGNRLVGC
jgi:methanogenic corrinoid protein MtbC1